MKVGEIYIDNVTKIYSPRLITNRKKKFIALNKINLKISSGDRLGIVGSNGSGKTTLLKIISGISNPTSGKILSKGKIVSLLDLGAGFHPDISGYDNIPLNGLLAGLNRREVMNKVNKIIIDSGIAEFIDMPFYTYSSGMKLRLAFAIAINSDPDILIFDEIVSAGDESFIKMFMNYFDRIVREKKTLVFASHVLEVLSLYCDKILWIDHGCLYKIGKTEEIINEYQRSAK